ncbi:MAG: branched-chain amino acid ABC transporter substrate-binding protein [Proteobacteria bacterium]|nr:branched-chain amino acid ABC transporter substrate-binding protein [Pseudomonadota bacterium]
MSRIRFFLVPAFAAALVAFACLAGAQEVSGDPPDRVARLAYSSGDVEIAPAGVDDWGSADVNRPLVAGDRLLTGDDGLAALELGGAALRIDHGSAFNFLQLSDDSAQVELSQGTLNLRVRNVDNGQNYEVDTPTMAFIANQPGAYRIDIAPDGHGAMVTVFEGGGTVYGSNGANREVDAGQSYRFDDSDLTNVVATGLPSPDDFDRFCQERDNRWENSVSRRYVSPDVIGYDDLDDYGQWQDNPDYGAVWYPTQVYAGWAPYRNGHWVWVDPWGWTWVDDAPWGFAPFHYGRWVFVGNRWGWCPGPRMGRPVYAPALVAFVGGSGFSLSINLGGGGPVGWFPLGPRDIYVPPYRVSRNYFNNVNVTNIRNVYVNQTVINNYYGNYAAGRPMNEAAYVYRGNPHAFTAVPRNVFTGAKPVRNAVLRVPPREIAQARVMTTPHVAPTQASLAIRPPARPITTPARAFDRTVVAKTAPPPRPVPFATRERIIAKQGGAPIPVTQLHQMREQQPARPQPQRVQVVPAKPIADAALPPIQRGQPQAPGTPVRQPTSSPPGQARITPIQAPVHPAPPPATAAPQTKPLRPGELPSARFAHPERNDNAPASMGPKPSQPSSTRQSSRDTQLRAQPVQQAQPQQAQPRQVQQRENQQQVQQDQQRAEQARLQQQRTQQQQAQQQQARQQQAQQDQQRAEQARLQQQRIQQQQAQQQQAQERQAQQRQYQQQMQAQQAQQQRQYQQQMQAQQAQQQHNNPPPPHAQPAPPPPQNPHHKNNNQQDDDNGH